MSYVLNLRTRDRKKRETYMMKKIVGLSAEQCCKRLRNNVSNWKSVGFRQLSVDDSKALLLYLLDDCPFITYILISDY